VSAGVVALVLVLLVVLVVVGVVVLVDEVLDGVEVLVDEVLVGVEAVEAVCWWQSLPASSATVMAPWLRFRRSVGLIVTGSVWTSLLRTALALRAAPQLPAWTALSIWSAWLLSALD
jgi:hypothetical protein